mgnify:FL=1
MPRTQFQRTVFALLTVFLTVHAYVFYSLYVVHGDMLMAENHTTSVLQAIGRQGGVYMLGGFLPIWVVVLVEFAFAFSLEMAIGCPCSFKLASRVLNPRTTHPVQFETAVISATVGLMCPMMSFVAAWMYYPYSLGFNILTLLANWLKLMCLNFPFAWFTQVFFIQPFVRTVFKWIFAKEIKALDELDREAGASRHCPEVACENGEASMM